MVLIKERIGKLVEDLHELIYPESVNIQNYKMIQTTERFTDIGAGIGNITGLRLRLRFPKALTASV